VTTDELIEKYREHLVAINRARKTIHTQTQRVKKFFAWAEGRNVHGPADVTAGTLLDWQKHLADEINNRGGISIVSTQNQHLAALANFFGYLRQADYLPHDPTRDIEYARTPQRLPKAVLTVPEMKKLLQAPDVNTVLGYRDRTILEMLYSTGARRQELLNLTTDDVDLDGGILMIRQGKGSKDRVVPLGKIAAKYLETYLNGIRPELMRYAADPKFKQLFISLRGKALSKNALADLVAKYARLARLKTPVTPHTFRHTCATHMIRNRAGIRHVQDMLGHANLSSTEKYIRLTITDLKEAHTRFHPREKDP
jgi:integrase/recombinase XerD